MASSEQEILTGLAEIVNEVDRHRRRATSSSDKSFTDDLDIDSLSMVEIVVAAEEKFGVEDPRRRGQEPQDRRRRRLATSRRPELALEHRPAGTVHSDRTSRRARADRVVVTGLGATTPLGGDVPVDLGRPARRPVRGRARSTDGLGRRRCRCASPRRWPSTRPSVLDRGRGPPARPRPADRAGRRPRGVGRRRLPGGRRRAPRRRRRLRHRRRLDPARRRTTSCSEKGPRRVSPLTVPMLMPNGPAAAVGLELGAQAGVHTPVSACASGAEAIALRAST